jgi:hypothetical protein
MGEVIVGVQRAQGTPYPNWQRCEEVRNLILDIKINKDDEVSSICWWYCGSEQYINEKQELYERSTHLEAGRADEKSRIARWFRER